MLKRYATLLTAMILLWSVVFVLGRGVATESSIPRHLRVNPIRSDSQPPRIRQDSRNRPSDCDCRVRRENCAGDRDSRRRQSDREHMLQLLPQKAGEPLDRGHVRDSIRALYATGRFADIQAEVAPSGEGVTLAFTTSANFFVGAVDVEGAPTRPTTNQIVNASKFQLGERLHARETGPRPRKHPATHAGGRLLPGASDRREHCRTRPRSRWTFCSTLLAASRRTWAK